MSSGEVAEQIRTGREVWIEAGEPLWKTTGGLEDMFGRIQAARTTIDDLIQYFQGLKTLSEQTVTAPAQAAAARHTEGAGIMLGALEGAKHPHAEDVRSGAARAAELGAAVLQSTNAATGDYLTETIAALSVAARRAQQVGIHTGAALAHANTIARIHHPATAAAAEAYVVHMETGGAQPA